MALDLAYLSLTVQLGATLYDTATLDSDGTSGVASAAASAVAANSAPSSSKTSLVATPVVTDEAVATTDSSGNVVYVTVTSYYTADGPAPTGSTAPAVSVSNENVTLPAGWTSSGCHSDAVSPRSLSGKVLAYWGEAITSSGCAKYCDEQGFSIAGTEYGEQCFCGNDLTQSEVRDASTCDMECKGSAGETCGGEGALSVFVKDGILAVGTRSASTPETVSSAPVEAFGQLLDNAVQITVVHAGELFCQLHEEVRRV